MRRRKRMLDGLDQDFRDHITQETQDNIARGMSREEARFAALRKFGNVAQIREHIRSVWSAMWIEQLLQDVRYGIRKLRKSPGFTFVAIVALAIGIGVNAVVFTGYRATFGRTIDAHNPGEIANLALIRPSGATSFLFSYPDYGDYRDSVRSFSGLIAFSVEQMTLSGVGAIVSQQSSRDGSSLGRLLLPSGRASDAEFASVYVVSENYFKVLGVETLRGRSFEMIGSAELEASPAVMISENYWQRRFERGPTVLGETIRLNGAAVTVVGVTPRDFVGTGVAVPDFWFPVSLYPLVHSEDKSLRDRENQFCRMFGRLAPGASIAQAQAEMNLQANHVRTLHDAHSDAARPSAVLTWPGSPFPLPLKQYQGLELTMLLVVVASAMVLAVACSDVASLQLARASSRQSELSIRVSLGASRLRLIRQLLTESALLSIASGAIALLFTWGLLKVLANVIASDMPVEFGTLIFRVTPDLGIFAYVFAISLGAGILFGLTPAIESSRSGLSSAARAATSPARSRRLQDILIAAQVALSLVLMIAGSMFIRAASRVLSMETGYDSKHVVFLNLQFPNGPKYNANQKAAIVREIRMRLSGLPGVNAVTSAQPPDSFSFQTPTTTVAEEKTSGQKVRAIIPYTVVQANYFETLSIPVILGREFPPQASLSGHNVIVSESAAKEFWPDQNPVGRILHLTATDEKFHNLSELTGEGPEYQVIGVARDTRGIAFDGSDSKRVYLQLPEGGVPNRPILIRAQSDPALVIRAIDQIISSVDPDLVATTSTLQETLRQSPPFFISSVAAAFASTVGFLGLLLVSMGIYGTVSYVVVLRTREVGIRMAVGAQKRDILRLILRESTRPVFAGLVVGMFLAVGASYLFRGILYRASSVDVISLIGTSVLFLAITLLAAYPPSLRATRVDPIVALRNE